MTCIIENTQKVELIYQYIKTSCFKVGSYLLRKETYIKKICVLRSHGSILASLWTLKNIYLSIYKDIVTVPPTEQWSATPTAPTEPTLPPLQTLIKVQVKGITNNNHHKVYSYCGEGLTVPLFTGDVDTIRNREVCAPGSHEYQPTTRVALECPSIDQNNYRWGNQEANIFPWSPPHHRHRADDC